MIKEKLYPEDPQFIEEIIEKIKATKQWNKWNELI
jgi:hypothetical protein